MIRKANTAEDKKRCADYLRQYRLESPTDLYLFVESEVSGEILAAAGITIGQCDSYKMGYIEPYYADNDLSNIKLYCGCEGYLLANDCRYIVVGCEENENTEKMYSRLGFNKWSSNMNQYIKPLTGGGNGQH